MGEPISTVVALTPVEAAMAGAVGSIRHGMSVGDRRQDRHGLKPEDDGLQCHILGAAGELAVAKMLGRYWGGDVNTFKRPDLGSNIQVRTRSRHDYDLLIRPDDNPDEIFIHITGSPTRLVIHGWIYGREGMLDEFVQTYGGRPAAWFVPKRVLRPLRPRAAPDATQRVAG